MKFTINDFRGFSNNCDTILPIKNFIQNREFTFDELVEFCPKWVNVDIFLRYLNQDKKKPFLESLFGEKHIEDQYNQALKIFDENSVLKKLLDTELNKGKAIKTLETIFEQSFQSESYLTTNSVMQRTMEILLEVVRFEEDEFSEIMKRFKFGYWGLNSIEHYYRTAINSQNNTAWKSIEKAIDRKPFILKGKRMHYGKTIEIAVDGKWVTFRCTGWNDTKKIKFVTETEKQKRYSFDLKEFKEFFKDQEFRTY